MCSVRWHQNCLYAFGRTGIACRQEHNRHHQPPQRGRCGASDQEEGHNGDITFSNVSFKYTTHPDVPILKDVSFTIPVGKSVAFVGPSGCGKSTIISLIQRFYRPDTGSISLGGDLIESLNMDWYRGLLGAVNQEPVMFAGTIRSNLQLGVERTLTDGELEEALCLDFINEMPDRFDPDLGAVGKAVLGGQKQRLALSQSLDPPSGRGDECVEQRELGYVLDGVEGVERLIRE